MRFRALALAPLVLVSSASGAAESSVQFAEIYNDCKQPNGSSGSFHCLGYLSGVADILSVVGAGSKQTRGDVAGLLSQAGICAPTPASPEATKQAVMNWAGRHPESSALPAVVAIQTALKESWPCK